VGEGETFITSGELEELAKIIDKLDELAAEIELVSEVIDANGRPLGYIRRDSSANGLYAFYPKGNDHG
jgi:hypothetical protein